ncbi:MAG: ATP-dependent DNA helicase [Clostridium sp.]
MNIKGKTIRVSVRNLVEFVLRSGDIDNRHTSGSQQEAMQAGSRLHRKIQKSMGADYRAEVSLNYRIEEAGFEFLIEGRADGIIDHGTDITIDEIKGVYMNLSSMEEPVEIHLAQAMCYGYFYGSERKISEITLQITYCNIDTEEIRRFQVVKTMTELEQWFTGLIHEYLKWAEYIYHNDMSRDASLKQLEFPFPYREGQRNLTVSVYRTIARKRKLFIQAPTGIGKTLSTVFPALKAIGEGYGEKLFYLTAKTITRGVAEEAFDILRQEGLYFRSVTITAKEKLCFLEKPECNPDACPYAKGHFDRVNDAVFDIVHKEFGITREVVLKYAEEFQVCPFEFCLDISGFVDGIVCDYNYVFDPDVRLQRYFGDGEKGEYIFLVDEAHNLVPRAREMYSAVLVKEDVLLVKNIIKSRSKTLTTQLERLNKALLEMKRECETCLILDDAVHLVLILAPLFSTFEKFMDEYKEFENREQVLDFYFAVRKFLSIYERVDEHYRIYAEFLDNGDFCVKLLCVNPIINIKECLEQGNSTVFFSATMLPIRYYRELLSNDPEDYAVYVDSPFDRANRLLLAASDVTSRYTRRNESEYRKILHYIDELVRAKKGNYIVFFPSYQYMNQVYEQMKEEPCDFTVMAQSSHMTDGQREDFLHEFDEERDDSLVALCVMGGLFSEGIDLKEERLIGVIIVGTGLPMLCTEQEILKGYFDETEQDGFSFAYQYPGMNKVMQAAGRLIRTAQDRGVILLLDDRFLRRDYQELFPREWDDYKKVTLKTLRKELETFWKS